MTHPPPSPSVAPPVQVPTGVRIASTLCWVVGVLTILVAFAIGVPALWYGGGSLFLGVNLIAGAAVCLAGVLIRRQRRLGVLVMLLAWALPTVVAVLSHHTARGSLPLFVALLFAGANWKHFR